MANAVTGAVLLAAESARVTTQIWMPDLRTPAEQAPGPDQRQVVSGFGLRMFEKPSGEFTCATCVSFEETTGRCRARLIGTRGELPACEVYEVYVKTSA